MAIDCLGPERVARFRSIRLQRQYLGERADPQPRLVFQPIAESKRGQVVALRLAPKARVDEGATGAQEPRPS
jgi:hypothetical protein